MGTIFQKYYTKSNEIVNYMINKLSLQPNSLVLEPCAGDGVFVDSLLEKENNVKIDIFELDTEEANKLKKKYKNRNNVSIQNEDTLLYKNFINGSCNNKYDFIIANPPYGAWQDYNKREKLKTIYPKLYVKETYTTFLFLCLKLLKEEGRLVFITPDTYLNLHMHTYLRKIILQNALVEEIVIFPSNFFPGVNFGYSKMSIITLLKTSNIAAIYNNKIKIIDNLKAVNELISNNDARTTIINQKDIIKNNTYAFIFSNNKYFELLVKYSSIRVGDIANCVTGIYTGNDKKYIKVKEHSVRNSKDYKIISDDEIYKEGLDINIDGICNDNSSYIPIMKGGNTKYIKQNLWYINWSKEAVSFYRTDKKSRFQNSQYYFKQGIAVPMVSSNSVTASLLDNRIFDQSIVGVFPKEEKYILFLLAFFNTSICTELLRMINPSANNSANYIKKLPIIIPDFSIINHINKLVELILSEKEHNGNISFMENELENIFNMIFYEDQKSNISINRQKELFVL